MIENTYNSGHRNYKKSHDRAGWNEELSNRDKYRNACEKRTSKNRCLIQMVESSSGRRSYGFCNANCLRMRKFDAIQRIKNN